MDYIYSVSTIERNMFFARALACAILATTGSAVSCDELSALYTQADCCDELSNPTCARAIPLCADVTNGKVCFDGTDIVVKGLLDHLGFEDNLLRLKKHLIPTGNKDLDLGNAENKMRYLFYD